MKRNIFTISILLLLLSLFFIGCKSPSNSDGDAEDKNKGPYQAMWFEYTIRTPADDSWYYAQTTFFYINTDGYIERAGNQTKEYFGTQLETLQNQLSWSICCENSDNSIYIRFQITEAPVWADNTSDDNSNNTSDDNSENNNNNDNNSNSGDNENENTDPEDNNGTILPSGYEWWCFEGALLNEDYFYVLYNNTELIRCGIQSKELDIAYYSLWKNKTQAIQSFTGNKYKITDLTKLPAWALQ